MTVRSVDVLYIVNGNGLSTNQGGSIARTFEVAKRVQESGLVVGLLSTAGGLVAARERGFSPDVTVEAPVIPVGPRYETGMGNRALNYAWTSVTGTVGGLSVRANVTVTDSDYPCDIFPALAHRGAHGSRWVACIHHRIEPSSGSALRNASVLWQTFGWRLIARFADTVLTYDSPMGEAVARELLAMGASQRRLKTMTNGVDFDLIGSVSPSEIEWDGLFVGGLRPDKGLEDLPRIWHAVAAHRPGARLAVVGGAVPAYSRTFDAECKRLGIADDVTRLGNVGPERVYGLMKSARCVLAASRTEGWGTATCEALAAGAPVVAFDLPTTRYVFGEAVDLIPPFDAQAFARRVLKHLATPSAREAVDRRRAHVRQFDWSGVAGRDIAAIDEVSRSQSSRF